MMKRCMNTWHAETQTDTPKGQRPSVFGVAPLQGHRQQLLYWKHCSFQRKAVCLLDMFWLPEGSKESCKAVTIKMKASLTLVWYFFDKQQTAEKEFKALFEITCCKPRSLSKSDPHQLAELGTTLTKRAFSMTACCSLITNVLAAPWDQ